MVNRVSTADFEDPYYILQIADYDVDSITPFELKQNQPCLQGQRFSQIRYGSQVDLVIPLSERFELTPIQPAQRAGLRGALAGKSGHLGPHNLVRRFARPPHGARKLADPRDRRAIVTSAPARFRPHR